MDARTARETVIKVKLAEVFGNNIAASLNASATAAGIVGGSEHEKLTLMVNSICADPRVLGMWGNAQTERQRREWLALV